MLGHREDALHPNSSNWNSKNILSHLGKTWHQVFIEILKCQEIT
jgi:hypothetical protein